jgi:hypothetical protein
MTLSEIALTTFMLACAPRPDAWLEGRRIDHAAPARGTHSPA